MTFNRTFDYAHVARIITHPKIWRHVSDDFSGKPEEYSPAQGEGIWYVLVYDGAEEIGLWVLHPHNYICWEIHTCLLPKATGARGAIAAKEMAAWVWKNTPCRALMTNVPSYNEVALKFARAAGMCAFGRNPKSFQKHGKRYDQIMLGLTGPE